MQRMVSQLLGNAISTFPAFDAESIDQVRRVSGCEHPIRLRGSIAGGESTAWSTDELPGGIAYVACKSRRASHCTPCSRLYQGDAYQLIIAGLRGGKGTPNIVRTHPAVFATFTAPSFGPVHVTGRNGLCRPRRDGETCSHGNTLACRTRHNADDTILGQPICIACFDYEGAAAWNAHAGSLWRNTRIAIDRTLARLVGVASARHTRAFRTEYVKVVEFQKRGLVHYHVALRVDQVSLDSTRHITQQDIESAIRTAAETTTTALPDESRVSWGTQLDVSFIETDEEGDEGRSTRGKVAGYLAKYATKSSTDGGALDSRIKSESEIGLLLVNPHIARLVRAAWRLSRRFPEVRSELWANQLGYRGHFCSKSRRWSTTFTALRAARAEHQAVLRDRSWNALNPEARKAIESRWQFVGVGYRTPADTVLGAVLRTKAKPEAA